MMSISIVGLSDRLAFGRIVHGLTLSDLDDEAICARIHDLWVQDGLILFRGSDPTPELQIKLSRLFGELERHPIRENWVEGNPELFSQKTDPEDEYIYEVGGVEKAGWIPWHSDLRFMARVNHGGLLRSVVLPRSGGDTGFTDLIGAYGALPDDVKPTLHGLNVIYLFRLVINDQKFATNEKIVLKKKSSLFDKVLARQDTEFFPVVHPLVYQQLETGRTVLNFSPMFAVRVEGMADDESNRLLRYLADHVSDRSRAYFHHWNSTDMVLWDNWRILHTATGVPPGEHREVQRTTISGDYARGRVLAPA